LVIFIPLNIAFGIRWAIAGLIGHQLGTAVVRKLRGEPQKRSTLVIIALGVVFGGLGILFKSQVAVFLPGLIIPGVINLVVVGSLVINRPVFALIGQRVWPQPPLVRQAPEFRRTVWLLSVVFTIGHFIPWIVSVWLLYNASANTYLVAHQ